jgi:hypothetical protein
MFWITRLHSNVHTARYIVTDWKWPSLLRKLKRHVPGPMNSELIPVGNMPMAFLAQLAAAGFPEVLELELKELWWVARLAATTALAITGMPIGTPNLNHCCWPAWILGLRVLYSL